MRKGKGGHITEVTGLQALSNDIEELRKDLKPLFVAHTIKKLQPTDCLAQGDDNSNHTLSLKQGCCSATHPHGAARILANKNAP
jgi:hypothetical protein